MPEYRVIWEIDLDADDAEHAARQALEIQMDPHSLANQFKVRRRIDFGRTTALGHPETIDLNK